MDKPTLNTVHAEPLNILAIDTSFDTCSCALTTQGITCSDHVLAKQNHGAVILPMIASLLRTANLTLTDLHAIGFACGPGSFTAIRMATAVVQGLALPDAIPVLPISTLTALAYHTMQARPMTHCIAAINAHIGQAYVGCYIATANHGIQIVGQEQLIAADQFMPPYTAAWHVVGNGFTDYADILSQKFSYTPMPAMYHEPPLAPTILELAMQRYKARKCQHVLQIEPSYLHTPSYQKSGKS